MMSKERYKAHSSVCPGTGVYGLPYKRKPTPFTGVYSYEQFTFSKGSNRSCSIVLFLSLHDPSPCLFEQIRAKFSIYQFRHSLFFFSAKIRLLYHCRNFSDFFSAKIEGVKPELKVLVGWRAHIRPLFVWGQSKILFARIDRGTGRIAANTLKFIENCFLIDPDVRGRRFDFVNIPYNSPHNILGTGPWTVDSRPLP
jgi:hypothetical protein